MPTYAELGAKLLDDAATFFRSLGEQNPDLKEQMSENATVFEQMAALLRDDPVGKLGEFTHSELGSRLLGDAAGFFRTLADQNEPIKEQMLENADVYEQLGDLLKTNPTGVIDDSSGEKPVIHIKKSDGNTSEKSLKDIFDK